MNLTKTEVFIGPDGASSFWVRDGEFEAQDRKVIQDVYVSDEYGIRYLPADMKLRTRPDGQRFVVDVGAHIGTFTKLWMQKYPGDWIVPIEANPDNQEALTKNVWGLNTEENVLWGALTWDQGPVKLLNSIMPGGSATGGSVVVNESTAAPRSYGHPCYFDRRDIPAVNPADLLQRSPSGRVNVLKLDCEGSEYDILRPKFAEQVDLILGEYHEADRWQAFINDGRFDDWFYVEISRHPRQPLGIFHAWNPRVHVSIQYLEWAHSILRIDKEQRTFLKSQRLAG